MALSGGSESSSLPCWQILVVVSVGISWRHTIQLALHFEGQEEILGWNAKVLAGDPFREYFETSSFMLMLLLLH